MDGAVRTAEALRAHGAVHFVIIDSISPHPRAPTTGRPGEAEQMPAAEWSGFCGRIRYVARLAVEEYGLTASIHPHAGGFADFESGIERLLEEIDSALLRNSLDTGHSHFAGFDPVAFMRRHMDRIAYVHFKDLDPQVRARAISERADFDEACGQGIFCNLGQGMSDFTAVRQLLLGFGYYGWCTVEQGAIRSARRRR
jgi:inosose dehydratase